MRLNALAVVLSVNVAAAAALVWLWSDADRWRWAEPQALPPALEEVAMAADAEPAEVSRYRETLERPLFASTRRIAPRPPAGAEGQEAADSLRDVRLLGTYIAGNRGGIVVSRGGKVERVPVGASLGGWTVAGEEGRGATLVRADGGRRKLELALNTTAPAAPAAAKPGEQDAAKAPAAGSSSAAGASTPRAPDADQPRPSAAGQARAARSRSGEGAGQPQADDEFAARRRERLERLNARRAEKGLPPLNPQN